MTVGGLPPEGARDEIEILIRLAGRRPGVPEERAARVREAVHAHWRSGVSARRRSHALWIAGALAVAASVVALVLVRIPAPAPGPAPAPPAAFSVEASRGMAWIVDPRGDGSGPVRLREGDVGRPGAAVITAASGRLALSVGPASSVRLDASTQVRVLAPNRLALDRGAIYVDSGGGGAGAEGAPLVVETPRGTVREVGTQYEVRLHDGALRVRVRAGRVTFETGGGQVHPIQAASQLTQGPGGEVALEEILTWGPGWAWAEDAAPMPSFSGKAVRSFLEWVVRERGWTLRFADEEAARAADRIRLGGTPERLTLGDALDATLPACGMRHRLDGGTLIVGLEGRGDLAP